jgi:hypothetical protein
MQALTTKFPGGAGNSAAFFAREQFQKVCFNSIISKQAALKLSRPQ